MNFNIAGLIAEEIAELEKLHAKSTQVVAWYAHLYEVRGPFGRWFTVNEVPEEHKDKVASCFDDVRYAARAMNAVPLLIDEIKLMRQALEKIADPRKRDHAESDAYTQLGCVMNIASEALK